MLKRLPMIYGSLMLNKFTNDLYRSNVIMLTNELNKSNVEMLSSDLNKSNVEMLTNDLNKSSVEMLTNYLYKSINDFYKPLVKYKIKHISHTSCKREVSQTSQSFSHSLCLLPTPLSPCLKPWSRC